MLTARDLRGNNFTFKICAGLCFLPVKINATEQRISISIERRPWKQFLFHVWLLDCLLYASFLLVRMAQVFFMRQLFVLGHFPMHIICLTGSALLSYCKIVLFLLEPAENSLIFNHLYSSPPVHEISFNTTWGIIVGCLVGLLLLGLAFMFMWRKYTVTKGKLRMLTMSEIYEFKNGNREALPNNAEIDGDNVHYLPFNRNYEVLKSDLTIIYKEKVLGSGEFGIVFEGILKGTCVAVKTTKPDTDIEYFKALLKEVKVMTYIGSHPHIVELLGTVTNDIQKRIVFIVIELSPFGSLENYLKENRMGYVKFAMSNSNGVQKSNAYTNMPSNGDKFGLPYANITAKITTVDFVKWAYEIADGMSHLAAKKIIHGDLATRNIEGLTAKITDFGLSRQMYEQMNYVKKHQAPLPWRSMALEALKYLQFSTESDVWSYAITIWEIFSLGTVPFAGLTWSEEFVRKIEDGLRVGKPAAASDAIYQNMLSCWHPEPSERPSFEEIKHFYQQLHITEKLL